MSWTTRRCVSASEAIEINGDIYLDDEDEVTVVNIPPDGDLSDADELDEDATGPAVVHDVPGTLEVQINHDIEEPEHPEPTNQTSVADSIPAKRPRKEKKEPAWRHVSPEYTKWENVCDSARSTSRQNISDSLSGCTPVEILEKLLTPDIFHHIKMETLRYALDVKNDPLFSMNDTDLKAFIGILIFSGYVTLPSEKLYWSEAEDLVHDIVRKTMPRNRYMKTKQYLHVQDNSKQQTSTDRGFRVRPLIDMLNESFQKFGIYQEKLAVDEMIVRYYGCHGLKQFIRAKPIRFRYKLWALCGDDGYCHKFDLYCGKEQRPHLQDMPMGTRVVLDMTSVISDPRGHEVYFDNLFTSWALLSELRNRGIRATGTVRENRMEKCPTKSTKVLQKEKRGTFDYRFEKTEEILAVRWNDNKVVSVMTNFDTIEPTVNIQRFDRTQKRKVDVPQPRVVRSDNTGMGGVDLHDWLLGQYGIAIRGKKWYWCLVTRMLDMAIVNSWLLHRVAVPKDEQLSLLNFRREIALAYMKSAAAKRVASVRRSSADDTPDSLRYDGVGHIIGTSGGDAGSRDAQENHAKPA